jgi:hypothetical protein
LELVVDGECVGVPTAVRLIHWTDYDHFSRITTRRQELAIATQRRAFLVDEGLEERVRAVAQHIVKSLGSTVPLIERGASPAMSLSPLWMVTLIPAVVVTPFEMTPTRRGVVAAAVLLASLANLVAVSVWRTVRSPDILRTIYGVVEPALARPKLPFRYALALALAAHALLWTSILWPGGMHFPPQ